jgi:hypothetical protein
MAAYVVVLALLLGIVVLDLVAMRRIAPHRVAGRRLVNDHRRQRS